MKGKSQTTDVDPTIEGQSERIALKNLKKLYGNAVAVDGIDLQIHPGELFVLLGPSGCGKSTTLRCIAGLETPTEGSIFIGDENVTNILPQDRGLSMVFQDYALYPHKTVHDNLEFPLNKIGLSSDEKERRIRTIAELLEIGHLLDNNPHELSGGQRQRVAVGRTIIRDPRVFLMDEPLSNLDAKLRVKTRSEIRRLQQEFGTTTVYVTHDQEEALSIADRIGIMRAGQLEQVGTSEEVYTRPTNRFVAGFIGEPAMNFIKIQEDNGHRYVLGRSAQDGIELPTDLEGFEIGIRPEDVHLTNENFNNLNGKGLRLTDTTSVKLGLVEPLGNAYEMQLLAGNKTIRILVEDIPYEVRNHEVETVSIAFDKSRTHVFDDDGGSIRHDMI